MTRTPHPETTLAEARSSEPSSMRAESGVSIPSEASTAPLSRDEPILSPNDQAKSLVERLDCVIGEMRLASLRDFATSGYDDGTIEDLKQPLQVWAKAVDEASEAIQAAERQLDLLRADLKRKEEALREIAEQATEYEIARAARAALSSDHPYPFLGEDRR